MELTYLFDESGEAIAFITEERTIWSPTSRYLGSFPLDHEPTFVVDADGAYFGEVIGDRLCRRSDAPHIASLGRRTEPFRPRVMWGPAPWGSRSMLPPGYEDIPSGLLS